MSLFGFFLMLFIYVEISLFLSSIYVHRSIQHGSVVYTRNTRHVLDFLSWLFIELPTIYELAAHKKHHMFSDTNEDPHSPHQMSFINFWIVNPLIKVILFFLSLLSFKRVTYHNSSLEKYMVHTVEYENSFFYKYTFGKHIFILINFLLYGINGIFLCIVFYVGLIFLKRWFIGIIHIFGYTNYKCGDKSTNLFTFGFLAAGEDLHNNHTYNPRKCKMSCRWYEFDPGYGLIKILEKMKLCRVID